MVKSTSCDTNKGSVVLIYVDDVREDSRWMKGFDVGWRWRGTGEGRRSRGSASRTPKRDELTREYDELGPNRPTLQPRLIFGV